MTRYYAKHSYLYFSFSGQAYLYSISALLKIILKHFMRFRVI